MKKRFIVEVPVDVEDLGKLQILLVCSDAALKVINHLRDLAVIKVLGGVLLLEDGVGVGWCWGAMAEVAASYESSCNCDCCEH